jgi:type IV pilus assembly protein PilP
MKRLLLVPLVALLASCGDDQYDDLHKFMSEVDKSVPRKIEPLPQASAYEPFTYDGFNLPDPFKPRSLKLAEATHSSSELAPDPNRRREPLESFPLNALRMVGTMQQNKATFALIAAENTIQRVTTGNYLGQNDGVIVGITETEVKLKEKIQDAGGDWSERISSVRLADSQEKK